MFADAQATTNFKNLFQEFVMKSIGRPFAAGDVIYTTTACESGGFASMVGVKELDAATIQGESRPTPK